MIHTSVTPAMQQRQATDTRTGKPAYIYSAPQGWTITDGVAWNFNNKYNPAQLYARCYNNEGLTIQIEPGYINYYWANPMGNSGTIPPRDITDALKMYLSWFRQVPMEFTEATILSSSQQPGMQGIVVRQYGRIRAKYEKNGTRFDEIVYATMLLTHTRQALDMMGMSYNEDISWDMNDFVHSCGSGNYSPEAGLETAFKLKQSVRQTQEFYDMEQQMIHTLLYQQQKPAGGTVQATKPVTPVADDKKKDGHQLMKDTFQEIFDMNAARMAKDRERFDISNNQFLDNRIRDVEPFLDGKGKQYDLPLWVERAWVSNLDNLKMVSKDDYFYAGPVDTSYETWTRLQKKY